MHQTTMNMFFRVSHFLLKLIIIIIIIVIIIIIIIINFINKFLKQTKLQYVIFYFSCKSY